MIGLDIDRDYVRVVELKESSEGTALTKFGVARISLQSAAESIPQATARTIAELLKSSQIEDKEVYTSISGPRVQVRRIILPAMPREELSEAVKWEAKNFVPFPIENAVIDYHLLKRETAKAAKQELIVVAVDGEAFKRQLDIINGAGLKCLGISPISFALWELAKFNPEFSTEELKALVYLGEGTSCLTLFKDHELLFTRELDFSAENITRSLAAALDIKAEEAEKLISEHGLPEEGEEIAGIESEKLRQAMFSIFGKLQNELLSSLEYYRDQFAEEKIAHLFLAGPLADLKNLKDYLTANFSIPIEVADPLRNLSIDPKLVREKLERSAQQLALPIGLALGKSREINLLRVKAHRMEKGLESLKFLDYVQIPNSAIVGTLALFLALIFGLNFYLNFSIRQIKKDLDTKSVKLSQLVKLRDRKKAFEDISRQEVDVKLLLARVNSIMPKELSLSYLTFDHAKKTVSVGGESADPMTAANFLKSIEESSFFTNAELIEIKKVGDSTTFKVEFKLR